MTITIEQLLGLFSDVHLPPTTSIKYLKVDTLDSRGTFVDATVVNDDNTIPLESTSYHFFLQGVPKQ
jgi:hypothetical protein